MEAGHCRGVDFAVLVVGAVELNDHVSLYFVVANAGNVAVVFNVRALECGKRDGTKVFDLNGFCLGNLAHQDQR